MNSGSVNSSLLGISTLAKNLLKSKVNLSPLTNQSIILCDSNSS